MALQIRPVENQVNAGLSGALSGAGGAAMGFMEAQEIKERRQQAQQESDAAVRRSALAEKQQELALKRHLEQQEARRQRMDMIDRKQEAAGKAFDALRAINGRSPAGSMHTAGNLPMEFDAALDQLSQSVRAGGMTPAQAAQSLKLLGTRYEAALQRVDADALAKSLSDEIAGGYWSESGALGLESDVDGDGQPDEIADTPALLLQALQDGVPAEHVRVLHQKAKQAIDFEKARIQERVKVAAESEAKVMQDPTIGPVGRRLATERIAAWTRDEYPHTDEGRKQFDRDLNASLGGLVPVEKGGQRVYMSEAQRDEVVFNLEQESPMDLLAARMKILEPFIGKIPPFNPEVSDELNKQARDRWTHDFREMSSTLFGSTDQGPPLLAEQIQEPSAPEAGADTPQALFQTLLRGRDPKALTQDEKAEIALELRKKFGPTGGVKVRQ